jgi:hypothetical protein
MTMIYEKESPLTRQEGGTHYKDMAIQPAEFIHRNRLDFCSGNVVKYVCRHRAKNGAQDLLKAMHYIELLLELEYGASAITGPDGKKVLEIDGRVSSGAR